MGQTLTHGVYLPDEGERNCYSGLAGNWQILDNSVGTIAEHTSALAGKAPLVHTHSKSDITDFPVYGTTAGTICEGNDSRLSDARTPVAHTHTKSDVTDLLNSNFIPSANNSYNLGSSSYQWNNLYAKNYYYNGVAWGLDKANTWTGNNTFSGSNSFNSGLTINNAALLNAVLQNAVKGDVSTTGDFAIFIKDKVNGNAATSLLAVYRGGQDSGGSYAQISIDTKGNDNNRYNNSILLRINPADNSNNAILIPQRDKTIDLGTSSNKWKTLNGINPGALSFPKVDGWNSGTEINAAVGIDTTDWDMSGGTWNEMTNNVQDGWVYFAFQNCSAGDRAIVRYYGTNARYLAMGFNAVGGSGAGYYLYVAFPMAKGSTVNIAFVTSGTVMSKFIYPCMGNV